MQSENVVIIGAGPAGLSAAHACLAHGFQPIVLEKTNALGGIARTEVYKGCRFDIGGHRFFTNNQAISRLWHDVLGPDFQKVKRLSRIIHKGRFFNYPLQLRDTFSNLGLKESGRILFSYFKAQVSPEPKEDNFEQWLTNRFGRRLYETFFENYTEKVWGLPGHQIGSDWAVQRIKNLSLPAAVSNALLGTNKSKSLIGEFHYPVLGPGMMWQSLKDTIEAGGGFFFFDTEATGLKAQGHRIDRVICNRDGREFELPAANIISSMPIAVLATIIAPPAPRRVVAAAKRLRYRALIMVGLILRRQNLFPDQWIYIHTPDVKVGRIQNFKNWSAAMVPDAGITSLGMEYFCDPNDHVWQMPDMELVALATKEIEQLGLAQRLDIIDSVVIRQKGAYPIYDHHYHDSLQTIRSYLENYENLQSIGRNGMHRYNNMDHSMLAGQLAVQNIRCCDHDLWEINEERSYLEKRPAVAGQPVPAG